MRRAGRKMTKRPAIVFAATMLLLLSACTAAPGPADLSAEAPADLIAENNALNKSILRVAPGEAVTMIFENRDGTRHNFAVYESSDARQVIFRGEALTGPGTVTYTFTAPEKPGFHHFQCDFHPSTMNGRFIVAGTGS